MMLPLWTNVTLERLRATAWLSAARCRRCEPVRETGLMPIPLSARNSLPKTSRTIWRIRSASGEPASASMPA